MLCVIGKCLALPARTDSATITSSMRLGGDGKRQARVKCRTTALEEEEAFSELLLILHELQLMVHVHVLQQRCTGGVSSLVRAVPHFVEHPISTHKSVNSDFIIHLTLLRAVLRAEQILLFVHSVTDSRIQHLSWLGSVLRMVRVWRIPFCLSG